MRLLWTRRALCHLEEARQYIMTDNPDAAAAVADRIQRSIAHLANHPEIGRVGRLTGTRELIIPGLPFIVIYRIKPGVIEISAILHQSRRWPG